MTDTADLLGQAREAYQARDWVTARERFRQLYEATSLEAADLYALATCAWWLGRLDEAIELQQQAYGAYLDAGQQCAAAFVAIDTGYTLALRGDEAQGSGWIGRASRLLDDQPDCVEHGFLAHLDFEAAFDRGDLSSAIETAQRVHALGRRFDDATLRALGVLGEGRVLVRRGEVAAGMRLLDEAMLAAVSDDLDPGWAGNIYCHLMVACYEIADLRRAAEWTDATMRWCESMPGAGPFMGICRVHRAQMLQIRGAWDSAEQEATHVCEELSDFDVAIVAEAHYLLGDVRRQRGDLHGAEAAYREGHRLGRDPQPGWALCRLARGDVETALTSIGAAMAATGDGDVVARARLVPAAVEVALAAGARQRASAWVEELEAAAAAYGTTGYAAVAGQARGRLLLAEGRSDEAVVALRAALRAFQDLDAPYEVASVRRLLGDAYRELGDSDGARREHAAADEGFAQLGANGRPPDVDRPQHDRRPAGLTDRELEVLALVATGSSNQDIASELVLSVRTVERHLATIYQKLGLQGRSARAAAVSFALREGILTGS